MECEVRWREGPGGNAEIDDSHFIEIDGGVIDSGPVERVFKIILENIVVRRSVIYCLCYSTVAYVLLGHVSVIKGVIYQQQET